MVYCSLFVSFGQLFDRRFKPVGLTVLKVFDSLLEVCAFGVGHILIKKAFRCWLILSAVFLAGASAGAFLFDPCWRLDGSGNVEGHQAMLSDDAGRQFASEEKHLLELKPAVMLRPELDSPTIGQIKNPAFESNPDRRFAPVEFWTDHAEFGPFDVEAIADPHLDCAQLVTYCHATPSRFNTALWYRRLYIFQNQFNSIVLFSCLRDADFVLKGTHFGSISYRSPLVLSTYSPSALVWARHSMQAQDRHCAGAVNAWQPLAELSAHPGWLTAVRCDQESLRCDPDGARSHPAAYYSPTCQKERRSLSAARSKERSLSAARSKERIAASDCSPVKYAPNQQRAQYPTAHFSTETLDRLSSPTT